MIERPRPSPAATIRRRTQSIPSGLLAALALIAAIELSISRHWLTLTDPVGLSWRYSAQAASNLGPDCDLLCLGDSLVKHGVIPSVLLSASGLRAMNLSAARCPTLMSYYLFRQALDHGARPRAILLNAKPAVLLGDPDYNAQYWPYALSPSNVVDFAFRARRPNLIAATVLAQLLPSLRSRLQLRSGIVSAIHGSPNTLDDINPVLWRNWTMNSGANLAQAAVPFSGELPPDVEKKLHPSTFFAHPSNESAIVAILDLASSRDIPVYFLIAPLSPSLQAMRDQSGADSRYEQFITRLRDRYPATLTILDARRAGFQNADFIDATHLNSRGAVALTLAIANALSATPDPQKPWIALSSPPSLSSLAELPIEDLDQSRSRLHQPD